MPKPPTITHSLAEQHEALFLRLTALHTDLVAIAGKRAGSQKVSDAIRVTAESLLSDCAPFAMGGRLPVAAGDAAGLLVQLGQALAQLDAFEAGHSFWHSGQKCRCWRVKQGLLPVQRLRPELPPEPKTYKGEDMRGKLDVMIKRRWQAAYESGFRAGQAARLGPPGPHETLEPEAAFSETYPRIRSLD